MTTYGFVKVAAASPKMKVADPEFNTSEISKLIREIDSSNTALVVFPELCLTGYTCADLFGQRLLLDRSLQSLRELLAENKDADVVAIVGLPLLVDQKLYNCGVVIHKGRVMGVVPKNYPANYKEFYESRWFNSGNLISKTKTEIELLGSQIPFGNLIFHSPQLGYSLGIEICEDLWTVIPVSSYLALNGATIIANLSASNELVNKAEYRRQLVAQQSARCICGYVYASSGVHESTTDLVFGGDCIISENGLLLETSARFCRDSTIIYSEIDIERLVTERMVNNTYAENSAFDAGARTFRTVEINHVKKYNQKKYALTRRIAPYPFIPDNPLIRDERCQEIFNIQVSGLAKRIEHTELKHAVIGVSGGLDSTLALLVTAKTFNVLGLSLENIHGITMPGFGTTDQTYNNAVNLMKSMKIHINEINIEEACRLHLRDIGHPLDLHDVTFENSQARERTQVLMDLANKLNGLVIGTGDMSELALGWATYNGDHMSMYNVNSSIPKTLVEYLVRWVADNETDKKTRDILWRIIDTPISPELLPPDARGRISQKTEDIVGPYELHDFFLYYAIRFGMPPAKVLFLADTAFNGKYEEKEIKRWLKVFYRRFFSQQFKRSALPDGPKVGTISLSPRGDWRMPSDAEVNLWLRDLT